jgi:hypothetical protein
VGLEGDSSCRPSCPLPPVHPRNSPHRTTPHRYRLVTLPALFPQSPRKYPFFCSPLWCNVVNTESAVNMKTNNEDGKQPQSTAAVRASISFPPEIYDTLEGIAKQKKVSLAWVVREAAEHYIAEKFPLFVRSA